MPFNAQSWIDDIVRTSHYILPDAQVDIGDLDATPQELVEGLASIKKTHVDASPGSSLMPARIPDGSQIPSALKTHFEEVVQALASYGTELHPAVRHAMLAVALDAPDRESKLDSLNVLFTGLDNGLVYQPTMTWAAMLRPQWYEPKHYVVPVLKGGTEPSKETQGLTSSIVLTEDNMRINSAHMFSWSKPIELVNAKIPAPVETWSKVADQAWSSANPPATSLWAMSFGDHNKWWNFLPPGAAVFNPFYTKEHVAQLFLNSTQHADVSFTTRMGDGIADIFPIESDTALAAYAPVQYLLDAPLGINTLLSMYLHAKAPNVVFSIPDEWLDDLKVKVDLVKSLDLLPKYSIFQNDDLNSLLQDYRTSGDLKVLHSFMEQAVKQQMILSGQTKTNTGDVFDLGLPVDRYYAIAPLGAVIPLPIPDEVPSNTALNSLESIQP